MALAYSRADLSATDYPTGLIRRSTAVEQFSPRRSSRLRQSVLKARARDREINRALAEGRRTRFGNRIDEYYLRQRRQSKGLDDYIRTSRYEKADLNRRTLRFLRQILGE